VSRSFAVAAVVAAMSLPGVAAAREHAAGIDQMRFGGVPGPVRVGDRIRWTNRDMFRHSVTARDGSFDLDLAPGASGTIVLTHAGGIAFFCKYHPGMTGKLAVKR
jgi:plastocyanin